MQDDNFLDVIMLATMRIPHRYATMEKKLIQLTKEQMAWLRKESKRTGTPVNILIRQMVSEKIEVRH